MRQGLAARQKPRWRTTTDSRHGQPVAPNLLQRDFSASAPNRVWVADTTYLPVLGGFLFLVAIIDLFSRRVVGWTLGDRLDAVLVVGPTQTAIIDKFGLDPATMPMKPMSVEQCAYEGLDALRRNRPTHINGRINRVMNTLMPSGLSHKMMKRMMENKGPKAAVA